MMTNSLSVKPMTIQIDSREKERAIKNIVRYFDENNIKHFTSKMYVGDYCKLENPLLCIDRKQNLQELVGNVCQQHERFRAELVRAKENDIKLIILCEHGGDIKSLEDVIFWNNPRCKVRKKVGNKWVETTTKAMTGERLYKVLSTMREKYGVEFLFCDKKNTGKKIVELLNNDIRRD